MAGDRLGVHDTARHREGCRECGRDFRRVLALVPHLIPEEWTPRELRHSFVSLLSDAGVPIEDVSRLVGHSSTSVTELVYRHQIRPVISEWRDDHGSTLRFAGRPSCCRGCALELVGVDVGSPAVAAGAGAQTVARMHGRLPWSYCDGLPVGPPRQVY